MKKYTTTLITLCVVLLTGCAQWSGDTAQANRFSITPLEVGMNGVLNITVPEHHPANISIRDPSGKWHVVQDESEGVYVMPYTDYQKAKSIKIPLAQTEGVSWEKGVRETGGVFISKGEYLIYMADNLETEPENTFSFVGKVRVK